MLEGNNMDQSKDSSRDQEQALQDIGLVRASVILAVFLEVIPVEADIIYGPLFNDVFRMLVVKVFCLVMIFLPLVIYVMRNGLGALKIVWGRVIVVAVIVLINLAIFCTCLVHKLLE
jgi:hypothetical protein